MIRLVLILACNCIALYETVAGFLQLFGLQASGHAGYAMTGTFRNPGPYGGLLAVLFAILGAYSIQKIKSGSLPERAVAYLSALSCALCFVILPSTMSRAAWLALGIAALLLGFRELNLGKWIAGHKKKSIALSALILVLCAGLFLMKKESAIGRLHIWNIELRAMLANPWSGYGKGTVLGVYGSTQAEYFALKERSALSVQAAGCPEYAFNEYFRIGIEYGIPAMLAVMAILALLIICLLKRRSPFAYGLTAFCVFAFFSYPLQAIHCPGNYEKIWQSKHFLMSTGQYDKAAEELSELYPELNGNYRFLYDLGYSLHKTGRFEESISILKEGAAISSDPMFYNIIGKNHEALGHCREAEEAYLHSHYMVPGRIYPLLLLTEMSLRQGDTLKARKYCIASLKIKVNGKNGNMTGLRGKMDSIAAELSVVDHTREANAAIRHYENEPLKKKAAEAMIAQMESNYHYVGAGVDSIRAVLRETYIKDGYLEPFRRAGWMNRSYQDGSEKMNDADVIDAAYIIENIDLAFDVWQGSPWGKHYSFEDFCKYILPYKTGNERPDHWRKAFYRTYAPILDSLYSGSDVAAAVDSIQHYLSHNCAFLYNNDFSFPHLGGEFLIECPIGACREETDYLTYLLRSLGVAASSDRYLYSPDSFLGHSWNVFLDTTGLFIPTEIMRTGVTRNWQNRRTKGKVYRGTQDVTAQYYPSNHVIVPSVAIGRGLGKGFISVFSMTGWIPIGMYDRSLTGKACIDNIQTGQIYQPLDGRTKRPSGYPFFINEDNSVSPLIPDGADLQTVRLTRKHPLTQYWVTMSRSMDGIRIDLSRDGKDWHEAGVSDTDSLCSRDRHLTVFSEMKYNYVRFTPPEDVRFNAAEIKVYSDTECLKPIALEPYDVPSPMNGLPDFSADKALDGKNLTRYESSKPGASCTFRLEHCDKIGCIVYTPRNDDNYVSPGDEYELCYQNGTEGWKSLGVKRAESDTLVFEGVPSGALLWLHDRTKGVEEQVFRWIGGRQHFVYRLP